ncbi:MAG TPA: phosphohistidine phosphatase SixA [Gemmatimonadaceae bacterium]
MDLLVIRHAIALDREEFSGTGRPDSERPLTPEGREKMVKAAQGLREFAPRPELIGTSPFVRAMDTAKIVSDALGATPVEVVDALTPERRSADLLPWLERHSRADCVIVVGHEPHLSTMITWFLSGREESVVELKKGGACLLNLGSRPAAGRATMRWLLTPSQLRALA